MSEEWEDDMRASAGEPQDRLEQVLEQASLALAGLERGDVEDARLALVSLLQPQAPASLVETEALEELADSHGEADEPAGWDIAPPPARSEPLQFADDVGDSELDLAFAEAESDPEEMHDVNRVAERVLEQAEREGAFEANAHPIFATETMAELLEGQGDSQGAQAIRAALHVGGSAADEVEQFSARTAGRSGGGPAGSGAELDARLSQSARTLATLERWLDNVRRDVA
jgi:hypothetical protein